MLSFPHCRFHEVGDEFYAGGMAQHVADVSSRAFWVFTGASYYNMFQVHYAQAWGNINLFDFNDRLLSEKVSLHLWPMPQSNEEVLYPIGIPGNDVRVKRRGITSY